MLTPLSSITSKTPADGFLQLMVECTNTVDAVTIVVFQARVWEPQGYVSFCVGSFMKSVTEMKLYFNLQ